MNSDAPANTVRRGLQLEKVVLLGRTLEEYRRFFQFDPASLAGKRVLDIASGVSSFTAEISQLAASATAFDPIYSWPAEQIRSQCEPDLDRVTRDIAGLPTYRWDFYQNPEGMRRYRTQAYQKFLEDYASSPGRYRSGYLPNLPFESDSVDFSFLSYFLFVYDAQFDWEFHLNSIRDILRVTTQELRIYPLVNFEAHPSPWVARVLADPTLKHLEFKVVPTEFEFLAGSNSYLSVKRR